MPPLGIVSVSENRLFKKAYQKQPAHIQEEVDDFIREMLSANAFPKGRDVHPMKGQRNPTIYEAKINRKVRITFSIDNGVATLRRLGNHEIYDNP